MKHFLLFVYVLFLLPCLYATHERAGEITYKHMGGLNYQITLITYTYSLSPADRNELEVFWGDGNSDIIKRDAIIKMGNDIQKNTYIGSHTYPATGAYTISMEDPNRNQGILNVPNSVEVPFYIETELIISPFLSFNNSPVLENPPIDVGCVNQPFYHNPGAVDLDGDSLSYKLVKCKGLNGQVIPGYTLPQASNSVTIDSITGDFFWDVPFIQGEYNIAILIEEYRYGVKIGSVVRDMQIIIMACDNHVPEIITINDTCIDAGDTLVFKVTAKDRDAHQVVTLTAVSSILQMPNTTAYFNQGVSNHDSVSSYFIWATNCSHIQKQAYSIVFKAQDNGAPVSLVNMKTVMVTVIAPAPQNLKASPFERSIALSWDSTCSNAVGYKIYRREGPSGFVPQHCETGLPPETGFVQIGETRTNANTFFVDDNKGKGFKLGIEYCYRVVAFYKDFAESYASDEVCVMLDNYLPLMTRVSIEQTDMQKGKVFLKWSIPTGIDTIQYPGPYMLQLLRGINDTLNMTNIHTFYSLTDTTYVDSLQNTENKTFYYKIAFYNHSQQTPTLIDYADPASSVFLKIQPSDQCLRLQWNANVPWKNKQYKIYRYNRQSAAYDSIAITSHTTFTDIFLENGQEYCYYVEAKGYYDDSLIERPLLNKSQICCGIPVDNISPCTPKLSGETDCIDVDLTWQLPYDSCFDDIVKYYIYYSDQLYSDFILLDSISDPLILHYKWISPKSVVGCYVVRAVDSVNNYSAFSNKVCFDIDLCNPYRLPNIFSPNGDGLNDYFRPFRPYDLVNSVQMRIYNRWGNMVFRTDNPEILWDGKDQNNKKDCAEGVYYYVCDVKEYTLIGIRIRNLKGSVTIVR
jgi:gliding motility-associated-like protein